MAKEYSIITTTIAHSVLDGDELSTSPLLLHSL